MFSPLTGELEEWRRALLCSIAQRNSSSVSRPFGVMSSLKWHALCFSALPVVFWFRAAIAAGMKDYAGFTDRFKFFFFLFFHVMPSISLQTEFGQRPAAGHSPFVSVSLSFKQSQCHSLLNQRIATSVLALCVHSSIRTETQHAVQSLCLQCAIDKMSADEWNCKEHPLCVSLL